MDEVVEEQRSALTDRGCYPLDVRVEGGRTYRIRIAFGYPCR